jgi:hypothetical protein
LDTEGNVVDGFTPVEWESHIREGQGRRQPAGFPLHADESTQCSAAEIRVDRERKGKAIDCDGWGARIGIESDVVIWIDI